MKKVLVHGLIIGLSAIASIGGDVSPGQTQTRCGWTETVYNAGEPDNSMYFEGTKDVEGNCPADSMKFNGYWNDGPMVASIFRRGENAYIWQVDEREGVASSMEEAFYNHMPAYLTDPDHSEIHSRWGF